MGTQKIKNSFIQFILLRHKFLLIFGIILSFSFIQQFKNIRYNFDAKIWYQKNDPLIIALNEFEKKFGNDNVVIIGMETKEGIFTPKNIKLLDQLTTIVANSPNIIRVDSLTNFTWTSTLNDELIVGPFIPFEMFNDSNFLQKRSSDFSKHKILPNYLVDKSKKIAIVYGRLAPTFEEENKFKEITNYLYHSIEKFEKNSNVKLYLTGSPVLSFNFQQSSFKDILTITPYVLVLMIFYTLISFRSLASLFIPVVTILGTLVFIIGLSIFLGFSFNSLTFILPSIVIAIGLADTIHVLNTFFIQLSRNSHNKFEALKISLEKNLWPIFLTSISTAIGFFSLIPSKIVPVSNLGFMAGASTLFAFVFTILFVPPLLLLLPINNYKLSFSQKSFSKDHCKKYLLLLLKFKKIILISFFSLSLIMLYIGLQNDINTDPYGYFPKDSKLSIANKFINDKFKGGPGPELIIDSGEIDGIKDPHFLNKVNKFEKWINSIPQVSKVISIVEIIKEINFSINGKYQIPSTKKQVAEQLFLYTLDLPQGMDINNLIDLENKTMRQTILWSIQDSKTNVLYFEKIEQKAKELGLDILITGKGNLFHRMNDYVVSTFFNSMAMALALITIILIMIFKSRKLGAISLIPNFIPICFGAGILTLISQEIDLGCATVGSVTLGIAVDDTIHFLTHFQKLKKQGLSTFEALVEVLSSTGLALVITTLMLFTAFGLFIFAELTTNRNFGVLCSLVLSIALVCDLVILPLLLLKSDIKESEFSQQTQLTKS